MYKQPNHSYTSTDSLRRLSSNNPFRQQEQAQRYEGPKLSNRSNLSVNSSDNRLSNFDDWVEKNKQLVELSSDEDEPFRPVNMHQKSRLLPNNSGEYSKPVFPPPGPVRAGSDSSVNYNNVRMSSNNPFAAALNEPDSYVHHRDPPPPPRSSSNGGTPPARPYKADKIAPPSYEEAAGSERANGEYPREKAPSSSSRHHSGSRQHRSHSHSEPSRHRSSREKSSSSRHKSSSHRSSRNKSPKKTAEVKPKNLDTIDKLDVTGFFGGGFHHDGPFDACTPHRNKNVKQAPVMAFPPDGPNSSIKGFGGTDKTQQMNLAFGQFEEDQNEIVGRKSSIKVKPNNATTTTYEIQPEPPKIQPGELSSNPLIINFASQLKVEPVHGSTTAGLGSSTFIDGAPAPRGIETNDFLSTSNGGLGRKKSLVQRLRKNSGSENTTRRSSTDASISPDPPRRGSFNTVEQDNELTPPPGAGSSLLRRVKSLKVRR